MNKKEEKTEEIEKGTNVIFQILIIFKGKFNGCKSNFISQTYIFKEKLPFFHYQEYEMLKVEKLSWKMSQRRVKKWFLPEVQFSGRVSLEKHHNSKIKISLNQNENNFPWRNHFISLF